MGSDGGLTKFRRTHRLTQYKHPGNLILSLFLRIEMIFAVWQFVAIRAPDDMVAGFAQV